MNTERFPLDFDILKRGDYLPPEEVEKATLSNRRDKDYNLKALNLASEIRKFFFYERADHVAVVIDSDGLRILTHPEQAEYARKMEHTGIKKILNSKGYGGAVDAAQLSADQRESHERWMHRNSWRIQQLRKPPPPELTN